MTLVSAVETYVRLKQSLGAVFSVDARILAEFARTVGDVSVSTMFLNVRGQCLTRFGIHAVVERAVARAATRMPSLNTKRISPHSVRHNIETSITLWSIDVEGIH